MAQCEDCGVELTSHHIVPIGMIPITSKHEPIEVTIGPFGIETHKVVCEDCAGAYDED